MKLISTESLLKKFDTGALLFESDIRKIIEEEPEAVVRCKDCINFTRGKDEWGSCFENPMKMWRETDFCSWAERKEK